MKKLGRKEAWDKCLRMWDWMAGYIKRMDREDPDWNDECAEYKGSCAKKQYLNEHLESDAGSIPYNCYFCEYAGHTHSDSSCGDCPPIEVDADFECEDGATFGEHDWNEDPIEFYMHIKKLYYKACKKHGWKPIKLKN